MESLETAAGSPEGHDRDVAPKKCTPEAAEISRSPSVEVEGKGWRRHLQEGPARDACGPKKAAASGKSLTFEDSVSQTQDTEASSFSLQAAKAAGRLKKSPSSPERQSCHSGMEPQPDTGGKAEPKAQKPGKYVCDYCGRACAKPSVLKKHIRSHTGERPYPCVPCGFSFKTKSNLYKHRKSHAHSVKAGASPFSQNVNADQGSFEGELFSDAEQSTDTDEDAFNDPLLLLDSPAEASDHTAVKVLNLISHKKASAASMSTQDGSSRVPEGTASPAAAAAVEAHRAIQTCTIKQRLALRLSEKRSSDSEHNLSLPSQSSKGSTDSGYFSRSESAEHQTGPPNANAKSYQEIMFGKCYRPSPKQTAAYVSGEAGRCSEKGVSRVFTQEKDTVDSIKINTKSFTREEAKESQFDSGSDAGTLLRSNSMPASSAVSLTVPQALRGSRSFDERAGNAGMRRLRRQAAFELPSNEGHPESDGHGKASDASPAGPETDNYPPSGNPQRHATELATRKRRKEKREEEDLPPRYEVHREQCEEMFDSGKDFEGAIGVAKGRLSTQPDSVDMDVSVGPETGARKTLGNVISVIQYTKFINRPHADPSDSYKSLGQRQEAFPSFQPMEESFEMDRGHGVLRRSFQLAAKLVRQPNIQVPEIRVTVEPDSPEKAADAPAREPEKHAEEFQWPQRSETLAQFPPEKLPPKKKRLRLADIEHSSGESSFESACAGLSRSPSQDSNLSYGSAFSFDREESPKPVSPARRDEFGKPLERLAVPGSGRSLSVLHHRQQHEMRRSSSEQAPRNLREEFPEVRSVSFDYGSLDPTSKVRPGDLAKERRRGNLVRQESLSMDAEASHAPAFPPPLPGFSTGNALPHPPRPGLLIPVRIQTHVPSYGSLTYTSVSQIVDNYYDGVSPALTPCQNRAAAARAVSIEVLDLSSAKLKTGIPLSLTSRTISTTNASSGGANKRMLSPASSLDLFMEVKQQKRVKEERMFGQIVEELSAVELGKCHSEDDSHGRKFSSARKATDDRGAESAMESGSSETGSPAYPKETGTERRAQMDTGARPLFGRDVAVSGAERRGTPSPFPSLRTATGVSWCYLSYTKPSCSHDDEGAAPCSVYAAWQNVSARDPNPPELSTSAALALLRSRQKGGKLIYSMAAMCQPDNGKLVSSLVLWRQTVEQLQRKPEPKETDVNPGKKAKDTSFRLKAAKEEWKEREASNTQTAPMRIKIFEGGYKSNEDYVYVRGRGRGKYICEECGIRCKKPSMLKKHIRTHTDVRPYICKVCNFAFKTKGNLTKHMKSKAHMKKCLELGVSVSMDETEIQEHVDEAPQESKAEAAAAAKHQFSDAEYSDGMDEDADDVDEDDDEDDDYEGDSTPKLRSRSTSPQPGGGIASLPVTVTVSGRWPGSDRRDKTAEDDSLSVLSPEQAGFLFDPYSSCLLSPGWESPIRELSPSRLRYPSPRRELSPRGRCSPRWDASPLRPASPGFSPIQHLSPPVAPERPASPGAEMAGKRESAVRGRQRVVLRAVSPRRGGSHQQRGCSDKSRQQHPKMDLAQQQGAFEMELEQRSISSLPVATGGPPQNLLSHLPLHSQRQSFSLLPLLPVGGAPLRASPPSPASCDVPPSPPTSEMAQEERGSPDSGIRDGGQEENVQTCLKAIASLKIDAEDPH